MEHADVKGFEETLPIGSSSRTGLGFLDAIRFRDVAAVLILGLTVWGFADVVRRGRIVPGRVELHRTDFTVYTEAGAAFFDGRDPYRVTNPRGWSYLYPPLFAMTVAPLSGLDSRVQVGIWFAISVVLGFGCYRETRRLWSLLVGPMTSSLPLAVALAAGLTVLAPALDTLQRGQVGIALLYAMLLGLRLTIERRPYAAFWGGLVLAWPIAVKILPALPVGLLAIMAGVGFVKGRERRRAGGLIAGLAIGTLAFWLVIPSLFVGWSKNLDHLRVWARKVVANGDASQEAAFYTHGMRNQSLRNSALMLADNLRGTAHEDRSSPVARWVSDRQSARRHEADLTTKTLVSRLQYVVLGLLIVVAIQAGRRADPLRQAAVFGIGCVATFLLSPVAWGHYYLFWLPAILFDSAWLIRQGRPRVALVIAAIPALLEVSYNLAMPWLGNLGVLGLGCCLWFFASLGPLLFLSSGSTGSENRPIPPSRPHSASPKRIGLIQQTVDRHGPL